MKKFFTLFALLSVGLSAWAQTYTLELRSRYAWYDEIYNSWDLGEIKPNEPLRKLIHLEYNEEEQIVINEVALLKDGVETYNYRIFYLGEQYSTGWYDITFTYNPNADWNQFDHTDNYDGKYLNIEDGVTTIHLSDEITIGNGGYVNAIDYTRSCTNKWGTLCLPFDINAHQDDVTFYTLINATSNALIFSPIENGKINAGVPLAFKLGDGQNELSIKSEDVLISLSDDEMSSEPIGSWTMHGTFESVNSGSNTYYYIANRDGEDGVYYGTNITVPPYRAWFTGPTPSGAPLRISVDETEGLQFVEQEDGTVKVSYDLQGRKLNEARKGLMIENGKVIMVK